MELPKNQVICHRSNIKVARDSPAAPAHSPAGAYDPLVSPIICKFYKSSRAGQGEAGKSAPPRSQQGIF